MKQKTLDFLEAHKSEQPSTFTEDAKWRQENEVWLKWSRGFADGLRRDAHAPCGIRTVFYFRRSNMQEFCGKIRGNSRNFVIFRVKTFGIL